MKFKLARKAERDLQDMRVYIEADNPLVAANVSNRLARAFLLIAEKPEIGRPSEQANVREWAVPGLPYVLPYKVIRDTVYILRIWHTSRNRPDAW